MDPQYDEHGTFLWPCHYISDPEPDSESVSSLDMNSRLRIFIAFSFSWGESDVDAVHALRLLRSFYNTQKDAWFHKEIFDGGLMGDWTSM